MPLFYDDLGEKASDIAKELQNPKTVGDLLDKVEAAILERLPIVESFEAYFPVGSGKILITNLCR